MKNQNKILIVVTTLIMAFSMCFVSASGAAQLDKLSTTRKGVVTTTEPVFSSSEDTGTTESTTEATVVTTADKGNSTVNIRTSTNKADKNTTTDVTDVTAGDITEATTIRGTTREFAATGAPVEYEDTTYRAGGTFAATEATYTTEPMVITDEDSYTTIGPTYNVTDYNNGIEVYTYFGETTDYNGEVVESTENNENESFIKMNYKKLLSGLFIIIAVGLIATLVMFLKNRKDFRSSLYFKFK